MEVEVQFLLGAAFHLACLLPEVNVFQVGHPGKSTQLQRLHSVPSHSQLVHWTLQSLQHSRDVREVVERKPQAVELGQATQLCRQRAEVVSIQSQCLQAESLNEHSNSCCLLFQEKNVQILFPSFCSLLGEQR